MINLKHNNKKYSIRSFKDVEYLAKKVGYRYKLPPPPTSYQDDARISYASRADPQQYNDYGDKNRAYNYNTSSFTPYYPGSMHPHSGPSSVGREYNPESSQVKSVIFLFHN